MKKDQAKILPEGWCWCSYEDGSGHLESPDGNTWFSYDLTAQYYPYRGEYKDLSNCYQPMYLGSDRTQKMIQTFQHLVNLN